VAVVDIGSGHEALCVRSVLENLGAAVTLHAIGTPGDLLLALGQGDSAPPFLVLCGHGGDKGVVLGSYGPGIDTSMLVNGCLPPVSLAGRVALPGCVVLSLACRTGSPEFAAAFLAGSVRAYIAPTDYPSGPDALLFLHHYFFQVLHRRESPALAWKHAHDYDADAAMFQFFAPNRT
jgi:hypothetical protein